MTSLIFKNLGFHPVTEQWFNRTFKAPSPPQLSGWPEIAAGRNTLILAPTGSGKTLAAFLWCIDELFRLGLTTDADDFARNISGVHTLYISPLKALNNDIHYNLQLPLRGITRVAEEMGIAPPHIRAAVRTGDTSPALRQSMVKKPPHILITTPESLYLLLTSESGRRIFPNLRYLIVDEIHAVCNNKRGVHLSLSLERLAALTKREPIRIGLSATQKPLERIAAYLGGLRYDPTLQQHSPRPVTVVDAGQKKAMSLRVISPVKEWSNLPDATVWPLLIDQLYELITARRTTLVFVNMRAQTEKIARLLNEKHNALTGESAELALAHHGSISREMRYDIEARLKEGKIPAVIATASLELGIDIGSIDLVVQVQSPGSVSSALQRVGRSGHLLDSRSEGIIIPLYQADLDDCLAIAEAMTERDIEETTIPENALDVLAQQIVAEVSMRSLPRLELFRMLRGSYCYRHLSEAAFNQVAEMLSGRFGHFELRALSPRLSWDRVNDMLIARKGSRLTAVRNGGTIADRGYYGVYLEGAKTRLGEVEEEFVFESKVGDVFFLGNNEWRINEITRDRIMVTPLRSTKPRAPFWKAEPMYREFSTSLKIGAFRRRVLQGEDQTSIHQLADADTMAALKEYLHRQQEKAAVATDQQIVVEYYRNSVNEPHMFIHAPFGGRVIGAWATALATVLEKRTGAQVQFTYDDDAMLFRLLDTESPPPFEELLKLPFADLNARLVESLEKSPMFVVRFRHSAARALLLRRSGLDKRIPLWLQRLRAADLLQAVKQFPDFPILVETYRDCLEDLFDVASFERIVNDVRSGLIKITTIHTSSPSPMTAGLTFRFLSEQMYDYDKFRTAAHAANISSEFLADVLSRQDIPTLITPQAVRAAEEHWQFIAPQRRARDTEDLFAVIAALGPLSTEELAKRSTGDPQPWLDALSQQKRVECGVSGWQSLSELPDFLEKLRRFLRRRGPQTLPEIQQRLEFPAEELKALLHQLYAEKEVVRGTLVIGSEEEQWCDRDNFAMLYRQSVSQRRLEHEPADRDSFWSFLFNWHHLAGVEADLPQLVQQYTGLSFPLYAFERDVLPSRLFQAGGLNYDGMSALIEEGSVIAVGAQEGDGAAYKIRYNLRGQESLFSNREEKEQEAETLDADSRQVLNFLRENGACPHRDICDGSGLLPSRVDEALSLLARRGLACCDHYPTFIAVLQRESRSEADFPNERRTTIPSSQFHQRRSLPKREVRQRLSLRQGRWFLATSFAVMGKPMDARQAEHQARLLLLRYGVVVKEFYRRETGLLPWPRLFQALKKMEWSGEIRRGYFIEGLSGMQFASNPAVELLQKLREMPPASPRLLSTIDPALPFGGLLEWGLVDEEGAKVSVTRAAANHLFASERPLVYLENFALRLWTLRGVAPSHLQALAGQIKNWLRLPEPYRPRKKIEIAQINGCPASSSRYAENFTGQDFEIDGDSLVLWPSKI
jgi:ATP-dependent helicase Lhr and Lhr-like helicase